VTVIIVGCTKVGAEGVRKADTDLIRDVSRASADYTRCYFSRFGRRRIGVWHTDGPANADLDALEPEQLCDTVHLSCPSRAVVGGRAVMTTQVVFDVNMDAFVQKRIKGIRLAKPGTGNAPGILFFAGH
jgi:hypothetical protein